MVLAYRVLASEVDAGRLTPERFGIEMARLGADMDAQEEARRERRYRG